MWLSDKKTRSNVPDITPLVDLVFLLIIFFLLSTTFRVSPGIKVDLPTASSQKIVQEKKEINLSVDRAGVVYIDKEPVETGALTYRLAAAASADRDTAVLIRGDREAEYGVVVDVLGAVKDAGLHRIAIMTQRKKTEPDAAPQAAEE